ncbi:SAC3/GANP/Nin1/mts3/eIF-3 p25 family-domain-containing protein [Umbelopsis sp. PMI_123]|nr:SAC3/GANP/Nin1/mts3/eIF-3 p25 family-domain-containing protein [Umbelopsis sp. PMI_123]
MTTPENGAPQTEAWTTQQQWDAYYAQDPAYAAYYQQYGYPSSGDQASYNAYYQQYPQASAAPTSNDATSANAASADPYTQWYQQQQYNSYNYQQYPHGYSQSQQHYSQYPPVANQHTDANAAYNQYYPTSTPSQPPNAAATQPSSNITGNDTSISSAPWRQKTNSQQFKPTNGGAAPAAVSTVNSGNKPKMMLMTKKSEQAKQAVKPIATPAAPPPVSANDTTASLSADNWPESFKEYVLDAFECCPKGKEDALQAQLTELIKDATKRGTLHTVDWTEMDLPSICNSRKKKAKRGGEKGHTISNRIKHIASISSNASTPSADEMRRREARLQRFKNSNKVKRTPIPSPATPATPNPDVMDWDEYTIVGTSTQLEKQYLRLTSAPDPASVRPLPILRQTLELLQQKWEKEHNYTYMCDQFKSMRQDLTVQRIQNDFTVHIYETHARIALEMGDLGEYNQCQTQLRDLYSKGIAGNTMEFLAYRILYMLHTQNRSALNAIMAEIKGTQANDKAVQHALQVRSSLATSNYHRFFLLYKETPNMGNYLIHQFIERERIYALRTMCKAYRPSIDIEFIRKELAFENTQDLFKFLEKLKISGTLDDQSLDAKNALPGLNDLAKQFAKVDINRSATV